MYTYCLIPVLLTKAQWFQPFFMRNSLKMHFSFVFLSALDLTSKHRSELFNVPCNLRHGEVSASIYFSEKKS